MKPRGITEVGLIIYIKGKGKSNTRHLEFEGLIGKELSSLQVEE